MPWKYIYIYTYIYKYITDFNFIFIAGIISEINTLLTAECIYFIAKTSENVTV